MSKFIAYCDGGCRGNQEKNNVGGWGVAISYGVHNHEIRGGKIGTTNNQMEIQAVISALKSVRGAGHIDMEIYCDSAYVVNCMNQGWMKNWVRNGWKNSKKEPVKNKELWIELDMLINERQHTPKFFKVKGHSGVELNERADQLANEAMDEIQQSLVKESD